MDIQKPLKISKLMFLSNIRFHQVLFLSKKQIKKLPSKTKSKKMKNINFQILNQSFNFHHQQKHHILTIIWFKGTLSVYSSDPQCKEGRTRFTTVPLINNVEDIVVFLDLNVSNVDVSCMFSLQYKCASFFVLDQTKLLYGYRCESGIAILHHTAESI